MGGRQNRKSLLEELARFAAAKKVKISVVFDGAPEINFPDGSSYKSVRIFYNTRGSNADERIKRTVEASKERRTLIVVTDDRQLASYVRKCGAPIQGCRRFREQMGAFDAVSDDSKKAETVKPEELSEWMRYFGVDETDE
jgi:predicted RNA-binding protein with PIN domain